jgi:hypothetical protein
METLRHGDLRADRAVLSLRGHFLDAAFAIQSGGELQAKASAVPVASLRIR